MKKFIADHLFSVTGPPVPNGVVIVDDDGRINAIGDEQSPEANLFRDVETIKVDGAIVPGFVNAHCHLELSHLFEKLPQGTGLIDFIKNIQRNRQAEPDEILAAARAADRYMHEEGIVAVADIANSPLSAEVKRESPIRYHTFVEVFSFVPEMAGPVFDRALEIRNAFAGMPVSITAHSPYSVSKELFKLIRRYSEKNHNPISIHNQESDEENRFFRYRTGRIPELYAHFGTDISYFKAQARNSLQTIMPLLPVQQPILLVHNTYTTLKDIYFAKRYGRQITWCFCPGANLYIEQRLPRIDHFLNHGFDITLGTDSLASNTSLSMLAEMKRVAAHFPEIPFHQVLSWATLNGARFLGLDTELGSIEPGKIPGLNLITHMNGTALTAESTVRRLI
ncbi:MAG: amidohydrolase family protein [Mucilaginibacter polytrichastri]|nr:amidohydrolase family protein [Mucilaginibacter polytrichastri]